MVWSINYESATVSTQPLPICTQGRGKGEIPAEESQEENQTPPLSV